MSDDEQANIWAGKAAVLVIDKEIRQGWDVPFYTRLKDNGFRGWG